MLIWFQLWEFINFASFIIALERWNSTVVSLDYKLLCKSNGRWRGRGETIATLIFTWIISMCSDWFWLFIDTTSVHSFCAESDRGWWRSGYVNMITDSSLDEKSLSWSLRAKLSSDDDDDVWEWPSKNMTHRKC